MILAIAADPFTIKSQMTEGGFKFWIVAFRPEFWSFLTPMSVL
jgi:hypothetical protein